MEALNEIEQALKGVAAVVPTGNEWFETYWKPKFDAVRDLMVTPELKEAIIDLMSELTDDQPQ